MNEVFQPLEDGKVDEAKDSFKDLIRDITGGKTLHDDEIDGDDHRILAGCGPVAARVEVGQDVAEPEHDPGAVHLLDRLHDVGVMADDDVDQSTRRDRLGLLATANGECPPDVGLV